MPKSEKSVRTDSSYLRQLHEVVRQIAHAQANQTSSGSAWLSQIEHKLQTLEKEMGWGEGPKTEKPQ